MGFLREARFEISYMLFALGGLLTLLVVFHYLLQDRLPQTILDIVLAIGNWIVWFVVVGPLLLLLGGFYFLDFIRKRREFDRLLTVPSKARFVRDQDRLEELAWYLPTRYARALRERKRKWGIRD